MSLIPSISLISTTSLTPSISLISTTSPTPSISPISPISPTLISSLSPSSSSFYPVLPYNYTVSFKEVQQAFRERKSYSYYRLDTFPYTFLKALSPPFINILVSIIFIS